MTKTSGNLRSFIKRNAAYFIIALCIMAVGLSVTLALIGKSNGVVDTGKEIVNPTDEETDNPIDPTEKDEPVNPTPVVDEITYILPVENVISISQYSETPVFNDTLRRYSAHLATDFFAEDGTPVLAIADGTVESVETTLIYGTTVIINHGNGLKSIYNSLADGEEVSVGDVVHQGDKIGEVSVSNRQESYEGAHLHFSMTEDGRTIDPSKYLVFSEK